MEPHIKCLVAACEGLGLPYRFADREQNLVVVDAAPGLYFQINRTPFNSEVMAGICRDKEHTYRLLHDAIRMPKTRGFLDYFVAAAYRRYLRYGSKERVIEEIEREFDYPVVVKRNRGYLGINVFLCRDRADVSRALDAIFDHGSSSYDYLAIAQHYEKPGREYRIVCFREEVVLAYERTSGNAEFGARYWESAGGRAEAVADTALIGALRAFVRPAFRLPGLDYVGFDLLTDGAGRPTLLELNSAPRYDHYIRDHGEGDVIAMYEKILSRAIAEGRGRPPFRGGR